MKSEISELMQILAAVDRTAIARSGKIITIDNPVFLSPFSLKSLLDQLQSQVSNADAKGVAPAIAVADAATVASLAGEGWAYEIGYKDSVVSGDFRPFTATIAYTDKDGVSVSRAIKIDPDQGVTRIFVLSVKTVSDRAQLALPNSSGISVTVASNTIRTGSCLQVVSYTRRDLELIRRDRIV